MDAALIAGHRSRRATLIALLLLAMFALAGPAAPSASAAGTPLSPDSLGVDFFPQVQSGTVTVPDLSRASSAGARLARTQVIAGTNIDAEVQSLALAGMRLYPMLGLPCPGGVSSCPMSSSEAPAQAASDMAQFVAAFAQRYGVNGSFWSANPGLPYLPVTRFEIGNEPNMPLQWIADETHLHWANPSAYAQVYAAARSALHVVDPTAAAVVGGLADSASGGVDIQQDEQWLGALQPGSVDAVAYHPYVFDASPLLLEPDTTALRGWMDATGYQGVPLDVNEFDACYVTAQTTNDAQCPMSAELSSTTWGAIAAAYTEWALCTPSLHVNNVQPEWWGGISSADRNVWLSLVSTELNTTPYGADYLGLAQHLTTAGCPAPATVAANYGTSAILGLLLGSSASCSEACQDRRFMDALVSRVFYDGRRVSLSVYMRPRSGRAAVFARSGQRVVPLRRVITSPEFEYFTGKLSPGPWLVTVRLQPANGFMAGHPIRRVHVRIPRHARPTRPLLPRRR